jgi:hypothetical protein
MMLIMMLVGSAFTVGTLVAIRALQRREYTHEKRAAQGRWLTLAGLAITCGLAVVGRGLHPEGLVWFLWMLSLMFGTSMFFVGCAQLERAKLDKPER